MCGSFVHAFGQTNWQQVSNFHFKWNNYKDVHVTLEIPSGWNDPGDFTRICIQVPGHKDFTLGNDEGWVKYNSGMAEVSHLIRARKNLASSEYVLALPVANGRMLLFLTGYSYASSPGSLDILEISASGQPHVVLHKEELGLKDVRDLDHDGMTEVIGYPCLSEEFGNGLASYDPFNVYSLAAAPGGRAVLSIPLSRDYNLRHYYGWAGPECSEKTVVVLHPPNGSKPIVVSMKEAQRLTVSPHK